MRSKLTRALMALLATLAVLLSSEATATAGTRVTATPNGTRVTAAPVGGSSANASSATLDFTLRSEGPPFAQPMLKVSSDGIITGFRVSEKVFLYQPYVPTFRGNNQVDCNFTGVFGPGGAPQATCTSKFTPPGGSFTGNVTFFVFTPQEYDGTIITTDPNAPTGIYQMIQSGTIHTIDNAPGQEDYVVHTVLKPGASAANFFGLVNATVAAARLSRANLELTT